MRPCRSNAAVLQGMCKWHMVHLNESEAHSGDTRVQMDEQAAKLQSYYAENQWFESVNVVSLAEAAGTAASDTEATDEFTSSSEKSDPTRRQDTLVKLRLQRLRDVANSLSCNKLLLGDCADLLAGRFIASAAKVRPGSVSFERQNTPCVQRLRSQPQLRHNARRKHI